MPPKKSDKKENANEKKVQDEDRDFDRDTALKDE